MEKYDSLKNKIDFNKSIYKDFENEELQSYENDIYNTNDISEKIMLEFQLSKNELKKYNNKDNLKLLYYLLCLIEEKLKADRPNYEEIGEYIIAVNALLDTEFGLLVTLKEIDTDKLIRKLELLDEEVHRNVK